MQPDVLLEAEDGRFTRVEPGVGVRGPVATLRHEAGARATGRSGGPTPHVANGGGSAGALAGRRGADGPRPPEGPGTAGVHAGASRPWLPEWPGNSGVHAGPPEGPGTTEAQAGAASPRPLEGSAAAPAEPVKPEDLAGVTRLAGVTLPGLANAHSHAFHRALRGRTHGAGGDFWTWREHMYTLAARLDPATYHALARACFAEMALAGVTIVGEFHYLHHGPGGVVYGDPNAMGEALRAAAADAGIGLTLLDALYLQGDVDGRPLDAVQQRFSDGDAGRWAERVAALSASWSGDAAARVGVAVHSVRAVDRASLPVVASLAAEQGGWPVHVHVSEQPAENRACAAVHGCSPVELLADAGVLGPAATAVHATHVTAADLDRLATTGSAVCLCPTTERDLADGIGPARALAARDVPLTLGSDSHAMIDLLEEARAVELDERLASGRRGGLPADGLLAAATVAGAARLGWPDAGRLAVGQRADLVTVGLDSVRLAGTRPDDLADALVFSATAADVTDVVVAGRPIVAGGRHLLVDDVSRALATALAALDQTP
jgi:formiminoglutamate deiminase